MPYNSDVRSALLSYLPEARLADEGDRESLSYKYESQGRPGVSERLKTFFNRHAYQSGLDTTAPKGCEVIDFDGICLEVGRPSVITAYDDMADVVMHIGDDSSSMVHVEDVRGSQHIRRQFADIATYIDQHEEILEIPYVVGVTYAEMARLGVALGMRQLDVRDVGHFYTADIRAAHTVTFAGKSIIRNFQLAAVYLPTEEFVDRFIAPEPVV